VGEQRGRTAREGMMSDHGRAQGLCCHPSLIGTVCLVRRKAILLDFFRHAFDGSGADNFVSALHLLPSTPAKHMPLNPP
jgi:hypothetical protein